jgi:hypothetical protein
MNKNVSPNELNLSERSAVYHGIQVLVVLFSILLLIAITIAIIFSSSILILISYVLSLIIGIGHNIYYFRQLDWMELSQKSSIKIPGFVLLLLVGFTIYIVFLNQYYYLVSFLPITTKLIISTIITFFIGLASFSFPISNQKKILEVADKRRTAKNILTKVESTLEDTAKRLLDDEDMGQTRKVDETVARLDVTQEAVKIIALYFTRDALKEQLKSVDYFRYLSPFIGPVFSSLITLIIKQYKY